VNKKAEFNSCTRVTAAIGRDSRKSWQKMVKNTAPFCENYKNHGEIMAVYIAANLLKLMVSNSRKTDLTVAYSASK